ncbi:hypothetical protein XENOCAPTIV_013137 [Xenoophorus captivus]|uniref:Uncharacterized protein n=1 Tax=Xenoophorus captivus TaxID=1517983 RepID=A0ABV0QSQ1_9TELE
MLLQEKKYLCKWIFLLIYTREQRTVTRVFTLVCLQSPGSFETLKASSLAPVLLGFFCLFFLNQQFPSVPSKEHTYTCPALLTFQSLDQRLAVFNQLLDELVGFVQFQFVGLEPLPELWAVQVAVTELQSGESHLLLIQEHQRNKNQRAIRCRWGGWENPFANTTSTASALMENTIKICKQ